MCSGGFFLFRGGCYSTKSASGSEICTAAEGGKCTTCKTEGSYIFQNKAATVTLGNECILCSDTTNRDGYKGVANCQMCTAPSATGAAACSVCQEGYYEDDKGACQKCDQTCATCENAANTCTSCPEGKYLKDSQCVEANQCTGTNYPDKQSGECKACSEIAGCNTCVYNDNLGGPICSTCSGSNMVKREIDGTATCVAEAQCAVASQPGTHFLNKDNNGCILCSNADDTTQGNQGVANCKTCQKAADNQNLTCSACLDGYFYDSGSSTCKNCAANCATCTSNQIDTCTACLPGYFLKTDGSNKECVPCDNVDKGGREGCSACSNNPTFKCADCRANYRKQPNGDASDDYTCTKTCEDDSACGGTAGSCKAAVLDDKGVFHYYCSQCADNSQYPIDGICKDDKAGNTCKDGVCTSCTTGYFLYMGGLLQYRQRPRQPHVHRRSKWHMHCCSQQQVLPGPGGNQD
ncbi:Variant-specific surface protein [Giardia duodenalis]|uniref:Variant-specific surface protein n=1 Tax=Giardia intestinalis TaxID=5741 RepID=V6TMM5_GIAIN|nr:Variant-specific surface protein [Giardia intestinalis]